MDAQALVVWESVTDEHRAFWWTEARLACRPIDGKGRPVSQVATDAIAEDSDMDEEDEDILHEKMVNALLFFNVG